MTNPADDGAAQLDEAWSLLEEGRPQDALEHLAALPSIDEYPERWTLEANARLALDDLDGVRRALGEIETRSGKDSKEYAWSSGELAMREWRVADARAAFEVYARTERDAAVLERLALCAELDGDLDTADQLLAEAVATAPEELALPTRLDEDAFTEAVLEAIGELPVQFHHALQKTEVVIEPVPTRDLFGPDELPEHPPDLLGLFVGFSELEAEEDASGELPPRIYLFQRNLERASLNREELVEEISVTIYHEFAHVLGFDEEGVEAMGLE